MSPDEARAVLLRAFQHGSEVPDWAIQLVLEVDKPAPKPWWRRWLRL